MNGHYSNNIMFFLFSRTDPGHKLLTLAAAAKHKTNRDALKGKMEKYIKKNKNKPENLNITDKNGRTFLQYAAAYGFKNIAQTLIENGANVNMENNNGNTALHLATARGYKIIAQTLINHEAKIDIQNNNGKTALHLAAARSYKTIAQTLIKHEANQNLKDIKNKTALDYASVKSHQKIIAILKNTPTSATQSEQP
jgi:ankyrin repeat protein